MSMNEPRRMKNWSCSPNFGAASISAFVEILRLIDDPAPPKDFVSKHYLKSCNCDL